MKTSRACRAIALAFALSAGGGVARAHQQTTSFGEVRYPEPGPDGADLTWRLRVRARDLGALPDPAAGAAFLRAGLRVAVAAAAGGVAAPCTAGGATLDRAAVTPESPEPGWLFVERFACGPGARTLHLRYDLFFDHDPLHEGFTRLALGEDAEGSDPFGSEPNSVGASVVFQDRLREVSVDVRQLPSLSRNAWLYLRLGVAHILTGADHLAFLVALLLAAGLRTRGARGRPPEAATPGQAARTTIAIASAFTIAHSITLATQVLHPGWLGTRWVEPAIAFSVAYVGLENLIPRAPRRRWLLVFGFGLVHGLGFASVLREIGLPRRGLALSLVSFNLGVELGQLLVIGLALPLLVAAARRSPRRFERWAVRGGSLIIAAFGTFWLVARLVGGLPG